MLFGSAAVRRAPKDKGMKIRLGLLFILAIGVLSFIAGCASNYQDSDSKNSFAQQRTNRQAARAANRM
jgi:CHASE3 domain sensor protein